MSNYKTLLISGGGPKGISALGSLQYIYDQKLCDIDTYIGTSVGVIISYLLAIGYTPIEIMVQLQTSQIFTKLLNSRRTISSLVNGQGYLNYEHARKLLEELTLNKIGKFITLKQLKDEFKKELIASTYNYSDKKIEYLSYKNYPNLPCLIAVRMTSNIPLVFDPFKYMGSYYIDGGLYDNFPCQLIPKDTKTLALFLYNKNDIQPTKEFNTFEYIYTSLIIPVITLSKLKRKSINNVEYIDVIDLDVDLSYFVTSKNGPLILNYFSNGYQYAKKILEKK